MHFVADPALVQWGLWPALFAAFMIFGLPIAALRQHRNGRLAARVSRREIYASAIATHAMLVLFVWAVIRMQPFGLLAAWRPGWWQLGIGLAALGLGLVPLLERLRLADPDIQARTRIIAPRTGREHAMFLGVAVSAGIAEELAYRGLLFTLVASVVSGWWMPAVICAAAFGIVHLFQGWKGAGIAALMGLREHLVVGLTGTLIVAMLVHVLHDAIAGIVIGRRARRDEESTVAVS